MDKLLRLAEEHQDVFESLALFKKAIEATAGQEGFADTPKLQKFFQENVLAHFQYEENQIFPKVLKSGLIEAKKIVRQLQKDHIEIYAALDKFQDLVSRDGDAPSAARKKKITAIVKLLIHKIISHARKEDRLFFPLVKKLGIRL